MQQFLKVTLHVSVWVEMKSMNIHIKRIMSRSTWACELKSEKIQHLRRQTGHAPRERVSWNDGIDFNTVKTVVTLHVSVWVEMQRQQESIRAGNVTLHVSVWVEIKRTYNAYLLYHVTLHVSVWVEIIVGNETDENGEVTLHVSVWVEIIRPSTSFCISSVTLHVSVWVEISSS